MSSIRSLSTERRGGSAMLVSGLILLPSKISFLESARSLVAGGRSGVGTPTRGVAATCGKDLLRTVATTGNRAPGGIAIPTTLPVERT